jgi:hypothetical protein
MAELLLQCVKRAVDDAAMKCVPLVEAAAAALAKPPLRSPSEEQQAGATAADKAIFAAALCVGRWGKLLTVRAEAEEGAHAAFAALAAARDLAARDAARIGGALSDS